MVLKNLEILFAKAKSRQNVKIAVAAAEDDNVLSAVSDARAKGITEAILVGNKSKINDIAKKYDIDIDGFEIIDSYSAIDSAKIAVSLIKEEKAQVLMKGLIGTADFLRAVLNKDNGLRKGDLLSHIGFFEIPVYHKLIALTDAAQNIAPTLEEKVSIIKNSVEVFTGLGVQNPKIGVVAAVETVNSKMESTVHAAALTMMNRRGQIKGCIIDGPLAFDNIVSKEAAEHKGIHSDIAGDADLILAHDINVANSLYKSFTYFAQATVAAIVVGASVPIVLTSRADSDRSKLMSIALAVAC